MALILAISAESWGSGRSCAERVAVRRKRPIDNLPVMALLATKGDENWRLVAAVSRWQAGGPPHTGWTGRRPVLQTDWFSTVPHMLISFLMFATCAFAASPL